MHRTALRVALFDQIDCRQHGFAGQLSLAARVNRLEEVVELRQAAAELVTRILKTDQESMDALAAAELARRAAATSLEQGETTLAAYRRVLTPPVASASLLDIRG